VSSEVPHQVVSYRTPAPRTIAEVALPVEDVHWLRRALASRQVIAGAVTAAIVVWLAWTAHSEAALTAGAATTLIVFVTAVYCWVFTSIDDTYVALGAGALLVISGQMDTETLFTALGADVVWLLLGAFVLSAGVTASGLAHRGAAFLFTGVRSTRGLLHVVTLALVCTAFAVPSTSGRAALAIPIFTALAVALADRPRVVKALALTFPTVILLSAVGSYLGAGAHLVTSQLVETATGEGFDFARWLLLGLPLAVVASHIAAELILRLFTTAEDRATPLTVTVDDLRATSASPLTGPLTVLEGRAALLLCAVIVLWCTESLHGLHPAIVALFGALVATSPRYGAVALGGALKKVPWSLILFMAATLALGQSLISSGAADYLAGGLLAPTAALGPASGIVFVVMVVLASTLAHLVIQSRSARSAVLVPVVMALAPAAGVDPVGAAFASTAAAGFCHTLTSSAKPVAMFAQVEDVPGFTPGDLLRLSVWLAPISAALVLVFSLLVWPLMGLPIFA
jgi:anion transporter